MTELERKNKFTDSLLRQVNSLENALSLCIIGLDAPPLLKQAALETAEEALKDFTKWKRIQNEHM